MKIYFTLWIFFSTDGFTAVLCSNKKIATEGATITVTCLYDIRNYKFSKKYWCKGSSEMTCDILGDTKKFVKWNYKSRLILNDGRRGTFLVIMKQLMTNDSGMYWCGIDRPYRDVMTAMQLEVNKAPEKHKNLKTTTSSTNFSSAEATTAFPVYSTSNASVSLPSNSTCHHNVKEIHIRNWHLIPWAFLRWLILVILITTFIVTC
ncbi:CMRF35-like molecule 5 isoform X1 [Pogona vitticeps]